MQEINIFEEKTRKVVKNGMEGEKEIKIESKWP